MASQTETMKDLVNRTVGEALGKRTNVDKDEQRLGASEAELAMKAREIKEFEEKLRKFEKEVREKNSKIEQMRSEISEVKGSQEQQHDELNKEKVKNK